MSENSRPFHFVPLPFGLAFGLRWSDDGEWSVNGEVKRLYARVTERNGQRCLSVIVGSMSMFFGWSPRPPATEENEGE